MENAKCGVSDFAFFMLPFSFVIRLFPANLSDQCAFAC